MSTHYGYRLITKDDKGIYNKAAYENRHEAKSVAGKLFRRDDYSSVCVVSPLGQTILYLKKTPNGVVREENAYA